MSEAIETAKATLSATSDEEDSFLLAELIHNVGMLRKTTKWQARANGKRGEDRFEREVRVQENPNAPARVVTQFARDAEGDCEDDDGNKVRSIDQQLGALEIQERDLWEAVEEEGLSRRGVEKRLIEIQEQTLEKMKKAQAE